MFLQLDSDHEAHPPHLAHGRVRGQGREQRREQVDLGRERLERALLGEHVEAGQGSRAGQRVAGVGVAVEERAELLELAEEPLVDPLGGQRGGER